MKHIYLCNHVVPGEKYKDVPEITNELKTNVEIFHKDYDDKMSTYKFLKDENDDFQKEINRTLKFGQYLAKKKNPYNGENARKENGFRDIILQYKKKGYKIPDLSTEKNLFKPSALLIDNAELKQFFNLKKCTKDNKGFADKEIYFISKTNNLLYERLRELDVRVDKSKYKDLDRFSLINQFNNIMKIPPPDENSELAGKNVKELKKNVKELKNGNERIRDTILKLKENYDTLNDSDNNMKIKSIHSPKRKPKIKIAFDEFLKRMSKPKKEAGTIVEVTSINPDELLKRLTNKLNLGFPSPISKKEENADISNDKRAFTSRYFNKLGKKNSPGLNSIFDKLMRSTVSTNFDSVYSQNI